MRAAFDWRSQRRWRLQRLFLVILAVTTGLLFMSAQSLGAPSVLSGLVGKKRIVLLFSASKSDSQLDRQLGRFAERRYALEDRDVVVLTTAGNRETGAAIGYATLRSGTAIELRRFYEPAARGMTTILVGKDGTEKGRWQGTVDPQVLFDLIDAMPMRQSESGSDQGLSN